MSAAGRAAAAILLLSATAACLPTIPTPTPTPPPGSDLIPVECINVPQQHCPGVFLRLEEMNLTRAQVDRAVVTCIGRCTDVRGRADIEILLVDGKRIPFGETAYSVP